MPERRLVGVGFTSLIGFKRVCQENAGVEQYNKRSSEHRTHQGLGAGPIDFSGLISAEKWFRRRSLDVAAVS
jgi:hypothetical protein